MGVVSQELSTCVLRWSLPGPKCPKEAKQTGSKPQGSACLCLSMLGPAVVFDVGSWTALRTLWSFGAPLPISCLLSFYLLINTSDVAFSLGKVFKLNPKLNLISTGENVSWLGTW